MQSEIKITNAAESCVIDIEGTIGVPEEWQFDEPSSRVATYDKFKTAIESILAIDARDIVVNIRSTGGDVNDALLIYDALLRTGSQITTVCYGYTASAATIIAQAAAPGCRHISANSLYLIHNSTCATEGNAETMSANVDMLHKTDERLAALYAARSGRPASDFVALMSENGGNGRWLSPEEVLAAALADKIIDGKGEVGARTRVENIVRRVLSGLGIERGDELPDDINILHTGDEELQRRSAASMVQSQRRVAPTTTATREDPSFADVVASANAQAYADDINGFRRGRF